MLTLAEKINLDRVLTEKLKGLDTEKINALSEKCLDKGFHILKKENDLMRLAVILTLAVKVKEKYDLAGIDENIYYSTMSDIRIWCENNGNKGLKNYGWLKNHVSFELFRIGRLQFQFYECKSKTVVYNKLPFDCGTKLIYIHIPQGERLEKERCVEAIGKAGEFFKKYFPDYKYGYYFCESWLLFEGNRAFMAKDSNILSFMSLFELCYSVKIDAQAIDRIFGKRHLLKSRYPENTDLQRRAKRYMQEGNRLGIGVGVIKK